MSLISTYDAADPRLAGAPKQECFWCGRRVHHHHEHVFVEEQYGPRLALHSGRDDCGHRGYTLPIGVAYHEAVEAIWTGKPFKVHRRHIGGLSPWKA